MSRIYLLVEGQTEEAFVSELLVPHYSNQGIFLTPIIVSTRPGFKGGVVGYMKVRRQIERLCKQDGAACVSTLFDLYALPKDFPGKSSPLYPANGTGRQKADFLEAELAKDLGLQNFIPNFLVHEFEALLFVDLNAFTPWTDDDSVLAPLHAARATTAPEDINDGLATAPSKRILSVMPGYQKTVHGPLIACDIGLNAIRQACPHFDDWLGKLEALA